MKAQPHISKELASLARSKPQWGQLYGASLALTISSLVKSQQTFTTLITPDTHTADQLSQEIKFFLDQSADKLLHLPDWETLPYDLFSPHEDIISQRLKTLQTLTKVKRGLLVVPVSTLMQRLPPRTWLLGNSFNLVSGQTLDFMEFRNRLISAGYRSVSQVIGHGEFTSRGSIIDLFPMGSAQPFRIDLFDDEIESIRFFDPETQRSTEKVEQIKILPAHEFPLDEAGIKTFRNQYRSQFEGDPQKNPVYKSISQGSLIGGIEYYLPLFFEKTNTLFDYLPENTLFCMLDDTDAHAESFFEGIQSRYEQRRHDIERQILKPEQLYLDVDKLNSQIGNYAQLQLQRVKTSANNSINFSSQALPDLALHIRLEEPAKSLQQYLKKWKGRILFTADSAGRREFILDTLRPFGIKPKPVADWHGFLSTAENIAITVAPLEQGVQLSGDAICIIPEAHLLADRVRQTRRRKRPTRDADAIVRNLTDLHTGAPVVHEDHGVGRYMGLQCLNVGEIENEFLTLEYAGNDKLYVPVSSLHLISRYTGADADTAPLHKLGGEQWQRIKRKAAQKAHDVAAELLDIYARRAARKGHAYVLDEHDLRAFAASFPFEETEDQQATIDAVLTDLQTPQPMDRVVCGDVGFGKTEVAMRAAFVAANTGRQVAILVPTTLLAQQHGKNFSDRFADWPFRIETLSRFRTQKDQKTILKNLENGGVDIVIGTHKLLQKDIRFKNLGLVIIDEEQRFGVRHKERLKSLRAEVDMLTLTATPIPRTLNMSLSGLRDLSIIATPPMHRHAIKTFVSEWDKNLVQEACLREISRGGQIYYLHNEVKSIEKAARELEEIIPAANVRIAHGQMRERDLEQVMSDFYHQHFNVLVCTTIIETGIDIHTANTIIIQRADKFGLAQLHQLRGRVGRSHHRAYAYLITPDKKSMTTDAIKRLEAIESLEDLGVGFTLASHDLEIRGAGELLGDEQSGQIQEIGFSMYNELLERAVKALKSGQIPDELDSVIAHTEVDLGVPALLPDDYVPDVHTRLIIYKRIASAKNKQSLRELQIELIDRFGLLPVQTKNLFETTQLKILATPLGIKKLDVGETGGRMLLSGKPDVNVNQLLSLIQNEPQNYKLDGQEMFRFSFKTMELDKRIQWLTTLLQQLAPENKAA